MIESDRLRLQLLAPAHAEAMLKLHIENRDFLRPWEPLRSDAFYTIGQQKQMIRQAMLAARYDEGYSYGIWLKQADEPLIGRISLSGIIRGVFQNAHLGYFIDHSHNGQGYASEAAHLLAKHVFTDLGLHRIQAAALPHNHASKRVLIKNGFRIEGEAARYLKINGMWEDHILFAVTAEEFLQDISAHKNTK